MPAMPTVPELTDGPGLFRRLHEQIQSSDTCRLAVAFWGAGAIEELGLYGKSHARIVCNLKMGGTNPSVVEKLMTIAQVRHSDSLHSKVYVLDAFGAVGSSNISANGLSFQGGGSRGWFEANVVFGLGPLYDQAEAAFEQAWNGAREVSDDDLKQAHRVYSARRRSLPFSEDGKTLLEAVTADPDAFESRRLYIWYAEENFTSEAEKALREEHLKSGLLKSSSSKPGSLEAGSEKKLDAFEIYPGFAASVPQDADVLCFTRGPKGGWSDDGIWHLPLQPVSRELRNKNTMFFATKLDHIGGRSIGAPAAWKAVLVQISEQEGVGVFVDLGFAVRRITGPAHRSQPARS